MSKQLKPIPNFANDAEEQAFWEKHDSTDYLDWTKAQRVVLPCQSARYFCQRSACVFANRADTGLDFMRLSDYFHVLITGNCGALIDTIG